MKRRTLLTGLVLAGMPGMEAWALTPQPVFLFVQLVHGAQGQLYLATNRGLFVKANEQAPWRELMGPGSTRIDANRLALNDRGDLAAGDRNDTYVLRQASSTWEVMRDEEHMDSPWVAGADFFAIGDRGRLWRAEGGRWVTANKGSWGESLDVRGLAWAWGQLFLATDQGVLESLDEGRSWRQSAEAKSLGVIDTLLSAQGQCLYAHTWYRTYGQEHLPSLFMHQEQSGSWRRFAANKLVDHRTWSDKLLAVDGNMAYVQLYGGTPPRARLFRVQDGQIWTEIDPPFANGQGYISQLLLTPQHLYARTENVIYRSADQGKRWEPFVTSSAIFALARLSQAGAHQPGNS